MSYDHIELYGKYFPVAESVEELTDTFADACKHIERNIRTPNYAAIVARIQELEASTASDELELIETDSDLLDEYDNELQFDNVLPFRKGSK